MIFFRRVISCQLDYLFLKLFKLQKPTKNTSRPPTQLTSWLASQPVNQPTIHIVCQSTVKLNHLLGGQTVFVQVFHISVVFLTELQKIVSNFSGLHFICALLTVLRQFAVVELFHMLHAIYCNLRQILQQGP